MKMRYIMGCFMALLFSVPAVAQQYTGMMMLCEDLSRARWQLFLRELFFRGPEVRTEEHDQESRRAVWRLQCKF